MKEKRNVWGLELADIACEKSIYSGLRKNQVEIPADLPQF